MTRLLLLPFATKARNGGNIVSLLQKWRELQEEAKNLFLRPLGPLAHLVGVWHGTGYSMIFRPDFQHNQPFAYQQNITDEILSFIPLVASFEDRGATQRDISLTGLFYEQTITDSAKVIPTVLHAETGHWLIIPPTQSPANQATIARQGNILHGTSFIATGNAPDMMPKSEPLQIISLPTRPDGPGIDNNYLLPFTSAPLLPNMPLGSKEDPSIILTHHVATQRIVNTVTFDVTASEPDGIVNIPFLRENARVTKLRSVFYSEHVEDGDGNWFIQLQYVQRADIFFIGITWPHVSVATLKRVGL
jgi:hypothetical protein